MIVEEIKYLAMFEAAGHVPKKAHGRINFFAFYDEPHVGLVCKKCGFSECMWCVIDNEREIPKCEPLPEQSSPSLPASEPAL
jgi:ArsR family metal-binding transcriptional regulator